MASTGSIEFYDDLHRMRVGTYLGREVSIRCFVDPDTCEIVVKVYSDVIQSEQELGIPYSNWAFITLDAGLETDGGNNEQKKYLIKKWFQHFKSIGLDEITKDTRPTISFDDNTRRILIGRTKYGKLIWFFLEDGMAKLGYPGVSGDVVLLSDVVRQEQIGFDTNRLIVELPPAAWKQTATLLWRARYGDLKASTSEETTGAKRFTEHSEGRTSKRIKREQPGE